MRIGKTIKGELFIFYFLFIPNEKKQRLNTFNLMNGLFVT
jgi:hypothetical protein